MKFFLLVSLLATGSQGFVPLHSSRNHLFSASSSAPKPLNGVVRHLTSFTLAEAVEAASDAVSSVSDSASDAVSSVSDAASEAVSSVGDAAREAVSSVSDVASSVSDAVTKAAESASSAVTDVAATVDVAGAAQAVNDASEVAVVAQNNGWFGFLTEPIAGLLGLIHSVCVTVGVSSNAWGISIVMLTLLIKVVTFPLTKSQLESTGKMQAMAPAIKEIQAKYQSNPEVMNQKVAEFYQVNEINPLAGCLPSFVQIPIFIGLYRAVLNLAQENKLDEPFLFLPNLEGPTYGADPAHGSDWLLQGWTDAGPPLGWHDTIAFMILPALLVVSQFVSMELMQPKSTDPSQQQSNAILKVLPILIGWFALNVPAALSVYWMVNNIVTTVTSVVIRNNLKFEPVTAGGASASKTVEPPPTIFAPPREKPAGFGATAERPIPKDAVKPITAIDAEVVEDSDGGEEEGENVPETPSEAQKKGKGKRGRKRKN